MGCVGTFEIGTGFFLIQAVLLIRHKFLIGFDILNEF